MINSNHHFDYDAAMCVLAYTQHEAALQETGCSDVTNNRSCHIVPNEWVNQLHQNMEM